MDNFDKNVDCMKQVRPKLYQQLQEHKVEGVIELLVASEPSRDGNKFMTITRDGVEYRMNSNYRPLEEATRWSKQYELVNVNVILHIFGLGNGYCIRELINKLRKGDHIIIVEPSYQSFLHVLHEYDITDILEDVRVSLTVTELNVSMMGVLLSQHVHWMNLQSQIICVHPQYDKVFNEECKEYLAKLEENNYRTLVNRNTEAFFGRDLVNNTIFNYKYIPNSNYLLELVGKIRTDIPAIIVAAGPSLDLNIEELKRAKGKAVIVATDTALRYLHKHGIEADFAVTMDPQKPPTYFDNTNFEQMPLFCGSEANRDAICKHKGRKIWFGCHSFFNTLYQGFGKKISLYNPGGSVATAAFSICKTLGFETIILIGQDLAYKGEVTHAEGDVCRVQNEEEGICYVEGIDGKPIKSRHDWYIYLKWFESSILETKGMGKVIDATEGGAMIHGTEIMTLREAIDLYCKEQIDVKRIMEEIPVTFNVQELQRVYEYLENAYQEVKKFPKMANEIVTLCNKGLSELKKSNQPPKLAQIGKQIVERNILIAERPVYSLVDNIVKHDALKEVQEMCVINEDEKEGFTQTYVSTKKIFTSVGAASKEIEPLLKEAVEEFKNTLRGEMDVR
jgi:hypothetical protein